MYRSAPAPELLHAAAASGIHPTALCCDSCTRPRGDQNLWLRVARSVACWAGWVCCACWAVVWGAAAEVLAEAPSYNRDIRPILSDKCFACHGPDQNHREADLRLDEREAATASVIVPGNPEASPLMERIRSADPDAVMPPVHTQKPLSEAEQTLLGQWIAAGAPYEAHWAFVPLPDAVAIPETAESSAWARGPLDHFVWQTLAARHWPPAPEAPRHQWLRRVTFDLTGLPPTLEELDAFEADTSAEAYERVVERLLRTPAYAERMAADWLDAARYADTFGYQADRDMHVWPWRDWVIRAFQENLPYDQFLLQQLAGDMLPEATAEQRLATAFNRLHRQTNEGGSIEAEFRIEYVADRVRTMGTAILGLTLECARCHDHKYDPVSQREYYALQALFNNIDEHGLYSHFTETAPTPVLLLYTGDQAARHQQLLAEIAAKVAEQQTVREAAQQRAADWAQDAASRAALTMPVATYVQTFDEAQAGGDYRLVEGRSGKALEFGGDDQFVCTGAPQLSRAQPFTVGLWVRPEEHGPRMVVAHQSRAAEDAAFRGFSLVLDEGVPVVSLVHFWPGNAIQVRARQAVPLQRWSHLTVAYDGSSRASGVELYVDGVPVEVEVVRDKLTRDFIHRAAWGDSEAGSIPFALGARFRDVGFRNGAVDDLLVFDSQLSALEVAELCGVKPTAQASWEQHFIRRIDEAGQRVASELLTLRVAENEHVAGVQQIMAMEEMQPRRQTFVLGRGVYDAPGEAVEPGTPRAIFPAAGETPRDRLEFAQWLIDPRHPLTARVAVNRYWRLFFGQGLVVTTEDFGNQGEVPSHPELLDWLARRFIASGWDTRDLCRTIVLSATYRQASTPVDAAAFTRDPGNRWLARGPRHRLSAEQVRDHALAASGLLVQKLGGPSVYPYQPAGLWEEAGTGKSYRQSTGPDLYRRSMYSFWRRTSPPPSMTTFDAPSREYCLVRRERTATPMQALTLLNDPQFVEAARVIAERATAAHPAAPRAALAQAFRLLTSRPASNAELAVLEELFEAERTHYRQQQAEAEQYLAIGEKTRDPQFDVAELAAMTAAVQAIMSYDECVIKR
jgi:hypothetical protein